MALLTMTIGNFAALWQNNIKRMLGYSSIAHAGYVLVAVTTHSTTGKTYPPRHEPYISPNKSLTEIRAT